MSGHNKWSQIKRQKGVSDAKKSQAFSKMAQNISFAARKGDKPESNVELKHAIDKAKEINMPIDNIERAVKKGSGKLEGAALEEVKFEAYGPGGVAIIIEGITDSKNRTVAEIKNILNKSGVGKWAETGSVTWAFEKVDGKWSAKHTVEISETDSESLTKLLEALDDQNDVQELYTNEA